MHGGLSYIENNMAGTLSAVTRIDATCTMEGTCGMLKAVLAIIDAALPKIK
jgi:hypothetical protein